MSFIKRAVTPPATTAVLDRKDEAANRASAALSKAIAELYQTVDATTDRMKQMILETRRGRGVDE